MFVSYGSMSFRKVTRQTVDAWLVTHATPTSSTAGCMMDMTSGMSGGGGGGSSTNTGTSSSPGGRGGGGNNAGSNSSVSSAGGSGGGGGGGGGTGGSGATTPVRKISAHEFERGGLLKPIVNTIDGTPTFLSVSSEDSGQSVGGQQVGSGGATRPQRRSRHELRHLDEKDLIFELVNQFFTISN